MKPSAARKIRSWRENPVQFVHENFQVEPDHWQIKALTAIGGPYNPKRQVAMKACTGPGKSALLAWAGWHRLSCFGERGEHPKGAALSGEGRDNLRDNLWAELGKWQKRSAFLTEAFAWNKEQIYANDHRETWFLSARSYPKGAVAEEIGRALSGLHSRFPFLLLDETGAMPPAVGQKAEQIFTGGVKDALVCQAGNPTSTSGLLYTSCVLYAKDHVVITITADPDDPHRTPRVDPELARAQIKKYGRDNPWVMATILGLFPPTSVNALLGPDEVEAAMERHYREDEYSKVQKRLGIDVARFGDDATFLFPRQGLVAFKPVEMRNARGPEIAARAAQARSKWHYEIEFVDGTGGFGAGVVDALLLAGHTPMEIHFAGKANDSRYFNKRSEMWFEMANWVKRGGALPRVPELIKELTTPLYYFQDGKFRLEEKDQIKKRLGFSPDRADALGLTFAMPDQPATQVQINGQTFDVAGKPGHQSDYDPFAE